MLHTRSGVTFVLVTAVALVPAAERAVAERNGAEERWGPASAHRGNPQQGLGALELWYPCYSHDIPAVAMIFLYSHKIPTSLDISASCDIPARAVTSFPASQGAALSLLCAEQRPCV